MFGFLIIKAFFDMWDNLIRIVILNLGFILLMAILVYFPYLFKNSPVLFFTCLGLGLVLLFVYTGVVSWMMSRIADYTKPEISELIGV